MGKCKARISSSSCSRHHLSLLLPSGRNMSVIVINLFGASLTLRRLNKLLGVILVLQIRLCEHNECCCHETVFIYASRVFMGLRILASDVILVMLVVDNNFILQAGSSLYRFQLLSTIFIFPQAAVFDVSI